MRFLVLLTIISFGNLCAQTEKEMAFGYVDIADIDYSLVKLSLDKKAEGMDAFYDSCEGATVVYSGENHIYTPFNNLMSLSILKELNSRYNFRDHIIELGPARSELINQYLSGDSTAKLKLKASSSFSHFIFYEWLKKWNDTISDERKIKVHGIDAERFNEIPLMNIGELFEKVSGDVPISIEPLRNVAIYRYHKLLEGGLKYFKKVSESYVGSYTVQLDKVKQMIYTADSLNSDLVAYLGADYPYFNEQISYLKEYATFKGYYNSPLEHNWRETNMFRRLEKLILENPGKKFYGQFGRCHSIKTVTEKECDWFAFKSTMERIKDISPSIKTVSMGMFYGKSRYSYYSKRYTDLFKYAPKGRMSLFNLRPLGKPTAIADQFDFALVNDEMLKSLVPREEATSTNKKQKYGYTQYAVGVEYSPTIFQSGIEEVYALEGINFPSSNIWHLGLFARAKFTNRISTEFGYSWSISDMSNFNNSVALDFRASAIRWNMGYLIINKPKFEMDIHAGLMYTSQKLGYEQKSNATFGVSSFSNFKRQEVLQAYGLNIQVVIFPGSFLGLSADYTAAISSGQEKGWSLNNSAPDKYFGNRINNVYASPIAAQIKWGVHL